MKRVGTSRSSDGFESLAIKHTSMVDSGLRIVDSKHVLVTRIHAIMCIYRVDIEDTRGRREREREEGLERRRPSSFVTKTV